MKTKFHGRDINVRRVGILTGGGDCAGLNAVIFGLLRRIEKANQNLLAHEQMGLIGLFDGWKSLSEDAGFFYAAPTSLKLEALHDAFRESGTILGTSRTNIYSEKNAAKGIPKIVMRNIENFKIDVLCALGGDDTLGAAKKLSDEFDLPVLGAPKTMDNDVFGTERTFGFESAYVEAERVIANIRATAKSHHRVFVVEVMGRHAGWVALFSAVSAGAGAVALPEDVFDMDALIGRARKMKKIWGYGVIVVAEGVKIFDNRSPELKKRHEEIFSKMKADPKYSVAKALLERPAKIDAFGNIMLSGVGEIITAGLEYLAPEIEFRFQNCGHAIRSSAHPQDIILGLRFGDALFYYIQEGKFGVYPALEAERIVPRDLSQVRGGRDATDEKYHDLYAMKDNIDFY